MADARWTRRTGTATLWLALIAVVIVAVGLVLARYDFIPKLSGLRAMLGGFALSLVALVVGIVALVLYWRNRAGSLTSILIGLVIAASFSAFMVSRAVKARSIAPLHDITTDLANPPAFRVLPLRADNLAGVGTVDNWRTQHRAAYPDITSVTIAAPVDAVMADAVQLARRSGWQVRTVDVATGHLEAVDSVSFIRFRDNVVLRVRPAADGAGSVVDMRSVSEVGVSDLGVNAARIRAFLNELATSAG